MKFFAIIFYATVPFLNALDNTNEVQNFCDVPGSSPYPERRGLGSPIDSSHLDMSMILKDFSIIKEKQQLAYWENLKSNGMAGSRPELFYNYSNDIQYIDWFEGAKKEREINLANFLCKEVAQKAEELRKDVDSAFERASEDTLQDYKEHIPEGDNWKEMGLWNAQKFLKDLGFSMRNDKSIFALAINDRISKFLDLREEKSLKIIQYQDIRKKIVRYLQNLKAPDMMRVYSDSVRQNKKHNSIKSKKNNFVIKYEDVALPLSNFLIKYPAYQEYCAQMDLALALYKNIIFIDESLSWLYSQCRQRGYALTRKLYMDVDIASHLPSSPSEKYAKWRFDKLMKGIIHVDDVKYLDALTFLNAISLTNDEKSPYYSMLNEFPLNSEDLDHLIANFLNKGKIDSVFKGPGAKNDERINGKVTFSSEILKNEITEILYQNCLKHKVWHDLLICVTCWLEYDYRKTPDIPLIYTPLTESHMSLHFYSVLSNPSGLAITLKPSLNESKTGHTFDLSGKNKVFPISVGKGSKISDEAGSNITKPILKTPKGSRLLSQNASKELLQEGAVSSRIATIGRGDTKDVRVETSQKAGEKRLIIALKVNPRNLLLDATFRRAETNEPFSPSCKTTLSPDYSSSGIFKSSKAPSKRQESEYASSIVFPNKDVSETLFKSDVQIRSSMLMSGMSDTFSRFTYDSEGNASYRKAGVEIMSGGCPKFNPNNMSIPISYDPQFYFSIFKLPNDESKSETGLYLNSFSLRHVLFHLLKHTFLDAFLDTLFKTGENITSKFISRIYSLECDPNILKNNLQNPDLKLGKFLQDLQKVLPKERRKKFSKKEIESFRQDPDLFTAQVKKIFYDEKSNIMFSDSFDIFSILGVVLMKVSGRNVLFVNEFSDNAQLARELKPIIYSKFNVDPSFFQQPLFRAFNFGVKKKAMEAIFGLEGVDYMEYVRKMKRPWLGCFF